MDGLESLFGAPRAHVAAERAIAEFRAGRPVAIENGQERIFALPIDGLTQEGAAILSGLARGRARVVLSGQRLARLGADGREPGAVAAPTLDFSKICGLACDQDGMLSDELLEATALERAGLHLAHLAGLLPALATFSLDKGEFDGSGLARVGAKALMDYKREETARLTIVTRAKVPLEGAPNSEMAVFRGGEGLRDHAAVIIGAPDFSKPVAVRIHSACLTGDLFGSLKCDCGDQLRMTARKMAENEGGVILYLDQEGRGNGLSSKIRAYAIQSEGFDTYEADAILGFDIDQRSYDFAALMLSQLGVKQVRLLTNNPRKLAAMERAGVSVAADQRVLGRTTEQNVGYLEAKRDKGGHRLASDLAIKAEKD